MVYLGDLNADYKNGWGHLHLHEFAPDIPGIKYKSFWQEIDPKSDVEVIKVSPELFARFNKHVDSEEYKNSRAVKFALMDVGVESVDANAILDGLPNIPDGFSKRFPAKVKRRISNPNQAYFTEQSNWFEITPLNNKSSPKKLLLKMPTLDISLFRFVPFVPSDGIYQSPVVILPVEKYNQIKELVRKAGGNLDSIDLLRINKNSVYELVLKDGKKIIMKEFLESNRDNFNNEKFFYNSGMELYLPKPILGRDRILMTEYLDGTPLSKIQDSEQISKFYNSAIDFLINLGKFRGDFRNLAIPSDKNQRNQNLVLTHDNLYPEHLIVQPNEELKVLDLEHICFAPIEKALAVLLINSFHILDEEFIHEKLEYFLSKTGIEKKPFYNNFEFYKREHLKELGKKFDGYIQDGSFDEGEVESAKASLEARFF